MPKYRITIVTPAVNFDRLKPVLEKIGRLDSEEKWCTGCGSWRVRAAYRFVNDLVSPDNMTRDCADCIYGRRKKR